MPFKLGLTGSIGMGKTTTAGFFAAAGIPVWDADAAVHRLYAPGGDAVPNIAALWPQVIQSGAVDRGLLKDLIAKDRGTLSRLETIVHPLVATDRDRFLANTTADIIVFDIPLLFEKGTEGQMDATLLVTAPAPLQKARVMARPGMTETQFHTILSRQMPDAEKRSRATHIIETLDLSAVNACVTALIAYIRKPQNA